MAGISAGAPSGGRRRGLDAEINLVPFIDLLSMCISFLLLTAVWINIGAVQIKQSHGTDAAPVSAQQYQMDIRFLGPLAFEVRDHRGSMVRTHRIAGATEAELLQRFDAGLASWEETRDSRRVSSVRVDPRASVTYGDMVSVIDVLRKHQIVNLAVLPGGES